jgi:hypothetical protein
MMYPHDLGQEMLRFSHIYEACSASQASRQSSEPVSSNYQVVHGFSAPHAMPPF